MDRLLYDAEHDDFRRSVQAFLQREVVPDYPAWDRDGIVPRELFARAAQLGAFAEVPEEYGGAGVRDFRYNCVLAEESAACAVSPATLGIALQADVVLPYLLDLTTDEQRTRWLPGVASGETVAAIAMTEPGAGSDLSGISTRAVRDGDHYVVDGTKTFITNGVNADLIVVAVRTGEHRQQGLSLLVVESGTPGFERGRNLDKLGQHAQDTAELSFTGVRVPAANLLGDEGQGFSGLTHNLPRERLSIAVSSIAVAQAALAWTIDHVRTRHAFGRPLGAQQSVRFTLAELVTEVEITQVYVDRCILELNAGALSAADAAKAKLWSTELQGRVLDACVQLHGGYGYMAEYPIARAFVDSRVSRIYGGASEIMKEIIGRSLRLT